MRNCPFCGSNDVGHSYRSHPYGHRLAAISCSFCGAHGPVVVYPPDGYPNPADHEFADQSAEERWERRAQEVQALC